jgi:ABC-type multidrug transport system ATPase subunit
MADQETPVFLKNILYQDEDTGKITRAFGALWTLFPQENDARTKQARARIDEGISDYLRFNYPGESASVLELAIAQSREAGLSFQSALQAFAHHWDASSRAFFAIKLCEILRRADPDWMRFLRPIAGAMELSPSDVALVRAVVDPEVAAGKPGDAADSSVVHFEIGAGNSDCCFHVPNLANLFFVTRRFREYYLSSHAPDALLNGKPIPANFAFRFSYLDELRSGEFRLLFRELQVFYRWFSAGTKGTPNFALRQNGRPMLDRPTDDRQVRTISLKPTHLLLREQNREQRFDWGEQIHLPGFTVPVSETAEVILALPRGEGMEIDERKRTPRCLLEVNNVCCKFGAKLGLVGVTFSATGGQMIAVMGPSGCGKSTLLGTMTGSVPLSSGAITIDGVDLTKLVKENPRFLGYMPQDDLLFDTLTVAENLRYGARLRLPGAGKQEIEERVAEVLQEVDLADRANFIVGDVNRKTLSGGQRKRLNLALELLTPKTLLLLDEPTSGLSSGDSERILQILRARADAGALVIVVIHQPSATLFRLFDRLLLLDRGGVAAFYGDPKNAGSYLAGVAPVTNVAELEELDPGAFLAALETPFRQIDGRVEERRMFEPHYWKQRFENFRKTNLSPVLAPVLKRFRATTPAGQLSLVQNLVLLDRSIKCKLRDYSGLISLVGAALVLGILTGLILRSYSSTHAIKFAKLFGLLPIPFFDGEYSLSENRLFLSYPFLSVIVALFLGMSSSITEILKERSIMRRERLLKVNLTIWLSSKFVTLVATNFIPIALYSAITLWLLGVHELFFLYTLYLWLVAAVGVSLGLMLSSVPNISSAGATTLLPLILVPQLILCGSDPFVFTSLQHLDLGVWGKQTLETLHLSNSSNSTTEKNSTASNEKKSGATSEKSSDTITEKSIPGLAELMPSRWAFEGLIALHLNNSRYGQLEILQKEEATLSTAANDLYNKIRIAEGKVPDYNEETIQKDPKKKAEKDAAEQKNRDIATQNDALSEASNGVYRVFQKITSAFSTKGSSSQKPGYYLPYKTQLGDVTWDNNPLHNGQSRAGKLLQRFKPLPFVLAKDQADLTKWYNLIPTEKYNAVVLVLLGLVALAISRIMIWHGLR